MHQTAKIYKIDRKSLKLWIDQEEKMQKIPKNQRKSMRVITKL